MDWLVEALEQGRDALALFQDPIIKEAIGLILIYAVIPVVALNYAKAIRKVRRQRGEPMDGIEFRGMLALVAGVPAMFFGHLLCGWPIDKAAVNAIFMAYLLPALLPVLLARIERMSPDLAEDIGELPTELKPSDTTEMAPMPFDPDKTTIVRVADDEKDEPK